MVPSLHSFSGLSLFYQGNPSLLTCSNTLSDRTEALNATTPRPSRGRARGGAVTTLTAGERTAMNEGVLLDQDVA